MTVSRIQWWGRVRRFGRRLGWVWLEDFAGVQVIHGALDAIVKADAKVKKVEND